MGKRLLTLLKWGWAVAVLAALAWVVVRAYEDIVEALTAVSLWALAGSILLTGLAKLLLGENARLAAGRVGIPMHYLRALRLYNLSQLGKYVPGSIWQFVGRAAAYRADGAGYAAIRDALLLESGWIVAAAGLLGVVLMGAPGLELAARQADSVVGWWLIGLAIAGVMAVAGLAIWKREVLAYYLRVGRPDMRVLLVQAGIWLLLGMAFWTLARGSEVPVPPLHAIGLFALGYSLGFMVPFAPAGLGIREAVLSVGLLPWVPLEQALVVTLLARAVYFVVDVGIVMLQEPLLRRLGSASAGRQNSIP